VGYGVDGLASLSLAAAAVALLLWGALVALRRWRPERTAARSGDCRVLRSLAIGPRERILIVSIGSRQFVIGVGAVSLLCELDEKLPVPVATGARFGEAVRHAASWPRG
jgi:flagellar biogenesis protein FliO